MNLRKNAVTVPRVLKVILLAVTGSSVGFAVWTAVTVGIVPGRYLAMLVGVLVFFGALIVFLLYKNFRRFSKSARTIAVIIAVLMIIVSLVGSAVVSRGIRALDSIVDGDKAVTVQTNKTFNVYISGIDTYGDLTNVSRSDVNIVATINPETKYILLTTIPRDSYVSIALGGNDQMDKLTHAGNYGVESSMKTVANLLETPIDSYVRINFSSFVDIIDTLGGVTVDNPTAFTSYGESFAQGSIQLDGKRALVFSRERKSLEGGDSDRGKNQQRVIQGVVDGLSGVRSISQIESLLTLIADSIDTNISGSSIKKLVNVQINSGASWKTEALSISGKGQTGGLSSYAMPGSSLYVLVLDQGPLDTARNSIAEQIR